MTKDEVEEEIAAGEYDEVFKHIVVLIKSEVDAHSTAKLPAWDAVLSVRELLAEYRRLKRYQTVMERIDKLVHKAKGDSFIPDLDDDDEGEEEEP